MPRTPLVHQHAARLVAGLLALGLSVSGCGSDGGSGSTGAEDSESGVRATLASWAAATTVAQQCDVISSGFRFFVGDGDPTRTGCVAKAPKVFGTPEPGKLVVHGIKQDHGQTLVDASVGPHRTTYYLVPQYGGWRINSIGMRQGLGPSPAPSAATMNR